jgi:exodeoxyribonuclease VII small subunit
MADKNAQKGEEAQLFDSDEISKMNFEQSIDTLTEIVEGIESGKTPLAESLDRYEKGMAIIRHCRKMLSEAEKRIENVELAEKKKKP